MKNLPKLETLVIAVFCFAFVAWAYSKCNAKRAEMSSRDADEEEYDAPRKPKKADTAIVAAPAQPPVQHVAPPPQTTSNGSPIVPPGAATAQPVQPVSPSAAAPTAAAPARSAAPAAAKNVLYCTIDGLKVRTEPGLKGKAIDKLKLFEEVNFLSQKTEWTDEISLGKETVTDHWVKVQTKRGKTGWVFGAGVHYYKMKRKGTLE